MHNIAKNYHSILSDDRNVKFYDYIFIKEIKLNWDKIRQIYLKGISRKSSNW